MPMFIYRGRDANGELVKGKMESVSSNAVADQLVSIGIAPIEISATETYSANNKIGDVQGVAWQQIFAEKIEHKDLLLFSRQMHTLIKSGVPILQALDGLQSSTPNKSLKVVLKGIRKKLGAGSELYVSLSHYPKVFSRFYVSMIHVGEMTGTLDLVFLRLYYYLEFEGEMRQRIKSALRYPFFVIIAMAVAVVVINIFVIPAFAQVYEGFNAELPPMTKILIGFSNFMVESWPVLLGATLLAAVGIRQWLLTDRGAYLWDKYKLRIPIAGKIIFKATLARFTRGFALTFKSGMPIVQCLTVVAQVVDNNYIGERIDQMRGGIERGESIIKTASSSGIFTSVVLQMIAVGEETGELDNLLEEVAVMYEREVEYEIRTLSQQIEPILVVGLGAMVLVLALGVFLPIWELGTAAAQ